LGRLSDWAATNAWVDELMRRQMWWNARTFLRLVGAKIPINSAVSEYDTLIAALETLERNDEAVRFTRSTVCTAYYWILKTEQRDRAIALIDTAREILKIELDEDISVPQLAYPHQYFEVM